MKAFFWTHLILYTLGFFGWFACAVLDPERVVKWSKGEMVGRSLVLGGFAAWTAYLIFR